jgi:predicted ATP-dependent protease
VNFKIEGHFDICRLKGLTGDQGVMIPQANVRNLMLRPDVVEAVKAGKFHIYSVRSIDEGIEVLTDVAAGSLQADGKYPEGTINDRVQNKLQQFTELQKKLTAPEPKTAESNNG